MPENAKKPQIRFKGFTDDWEQRKLCNTNTFFTDGNYGEAYPKTSDLTDSSNGIPFLTGGNLKEGKFDLAGANYITYKKHSELTSGHLKEDDIVIAVRGSLGALGYVNKANVGWNINSQLAILRTDKSILLGKYLIQFLLSNTGQNQLLIRQTGSALKQLPIGTIRDINVPIISIEEQKQIGKIFYHLNNLITLHQRKLEKLKNIKKTMLEKMFPKNGSNIPEIRFKGFTDAWEQRKLGKCFSERNESMPEGELISVTINEGIKKFSELGRHDNSNDDKTKYKKVCVGDIAYNSMRMWQGASGYSPYEGIVSPAYTVLIPSKDIDSKCLSYQFKIPEIIHTFQINSQGITSDNWNLKYPALSEIQIYVSTKIKEQHKIALFFNNLDNLITLHQRKLEKLQNIKKACLEKMFV